MAEIPKSDEIPLFAVTSIDLSPFMVAISISSPVIFDIIWRNDDTDAQSTMRFDDIRIDVFTRQSVSS